MTMTDFTEFDFIHPLPQDPHEGESETRRRGLEVKGSREESHESGPVPVDGAELLDQLAGEFRRFLILPDHGEVILALWNLHSYCFELFDHTPILYITSPTKQCAKSRVLEVRAKLAHNPMSSSSMTGATLFRSIEIFNSAAGDEIEVRVSSSEPVRDNARWTFIWSFGDFAKKLFQ